jgi:integrative and conjugative element protein (TIGR02256 family)
MQLRAELGHSGQQLVIRRAVVSHLLQHQQRGRSPEAGGQLFGRLEDKTILVEEATGPRRGDARSRYGYRPNRRQEQLEINAAFRRDLVFLGDWHTHPEPRPHPSTTDLISMQDCFSRSQHTLNAFLLLILGTGVLPDALFGSLHNRNEVLQLQFAAEDH